MKKPVIYLTRTAVIAAVYFALSVAFEWIAFGPVQFRVSELLTLTPVLFAEAVPGLAIGCFFTNLFFSPYGIWDMIFGTLATLLAAVFTRLLRKRIAAAALPPMLFNALLIPLIWVIGGGSDTIYYIAAGEILLSQFIICGLIGVPFTIVLKREFLRARLIRPEQGKYVHAQPYLREEKRPKHETCMLDKNDESTKHERYTGIESQENPTEFDDGKDNNENCR